MSKYFIKTYGCQMNKNDSEVLAGIMESLGYRESMAPDDADVILVNTCTVRQKAEAKALGYIAGLKRYKSEARNSKSETNSNTKIQNRKTIGICGCLPQQEKDALLKKFPFVDFVLGPGSMHELKAVIGDRGTGKGIFVETCNPELRNLPQARKPSTVAYVSIMYGCDNYCSFCIVPYVRGREVSRPGNDILREIEELDRGIFKEIVLLGQNVNSYRGHGFGLADLLREVHEINGVERIRFLTSHPRDMDEDIIQAVKELPKVCKYFHLPIQSGDDEILKAMNRGYDLAYYKKLVEKIRKVIPEAAITSDVVVGFPGETDKQFENTLKAIGDIEFDLVNTAAYSDRPGTAAEKMDGKLPDDVKSDRLQRVMKVVEEVAYKRNQKLAGRTVEILVDKENIGRTRTNKTVKFSGNKSLIGKSVKVEIKKAKSWVLEGRIEP
jgi:tRNA-2-methylthio-N6-dimethylallyladenosine synthase